MRKEFAVIFCFCFAIAVAFPRLSASHPMVDVSGCRACHELGDFALEGLHGIHTDCFACHNGPVELGNVSSSACLACHPQPLVDTDACNLILFHEASPDDMLSGYSCLSAGCHIDDCNGVSTTTTEPEATCPSQEIYGEGSLEVTLLRAVRDNLLSKTPEGQEIIKLYYQWSPVIARTMEEDEEFKGEIKEMVNGILTLFGGVE